MAACAQVGWRRAGDLFEPCVACLHAMCAELCLFSRSLKMQAAVQSAPRDKSLIFRPSADNGSRRRLRLLSCPNPVECPGSRALTDVRARTFDILRSTGRINHYTSVPAIWSEPIVGTPSRRAKRVHREVRTRAIEVCSDHPAKRWSRGCRTVTLQRETIRSTTCRFAAVPLETTTRRVLLPFFGNLRRSWIAARHRLRHDRSPSSAVTAASAGSQPQWRPHGRGRYSPD